MPKSKNHTRLTSEAIVALRAAHARICTTEQLGPANQMTFDKATSGEWVNKGCYRGLLCELNRIKGANERRQVQASHDSLWGGRYAT